MAAGAPARRVCVWWFGLKMQQHVYQRAARIVIAHGQRSPVRAACSAAKQRNSGGHRQRSHEHVVQEKLSRRGRQLHADVCAGHITVRAHAWRWLPPLCDGDVRGGIDERSGQSQIPRQKGNILQDPRSSTFLPQGTRRNDEYVLEFFISATAVANNGSCPARGDNNIMSF